MTTARYSLARRDNGLLGIGVAAAMGGVGLLMLWNGAGAEQPMGFRIPFWLAWFSILAFAAYRQLTSAREIVVHENDEVEFVSLLRRVRIPAHTIRSIRATGGRFDHLVVAYHGGELHLAGAFNQFHTFLTELESVNPGVEMSGC